METGVTDLLVTLIINVVLLIAIFVALLFAVRWRRRRKAEEKKAQTTTPPSSPIQMAESLPEPEVAELTTLPPVTAPLDDDDEMPDWLNDLD